MLETRTQHIKEQRAEIEAAGITYSETLAAELSDEYYEILEYSIKQGGTITQEQYNDLTEGQKFHFNKHYNHRSDKIVG